MSHNYHYVKSCALHNSGGCAYLRCPKKRPYTPSRPPALYLWRWKEKGGKDDLQKAKWFINDMIGEIEDMELQEELAKKHG